MVRLCFHLRFLHDDSSLDRNSPRAEEQIHGKFILPTPILTPII